VRGGPFHKSLHAKEQDRPDVVRRREQWKQRQGRIDPERLVFIDETWAKTNMTPLRGWCRRGERLKAKAPFGRWKTMTFIAALRQDRIEAPSLRLRLGGIRRDPQRLNTRCRRPLRTSTNSGVRRRRGIAYGLPVVESEILHTLSSGGCPVRRPLGTRIPPRASQSRSSLPISPAEALTCVLGPPSAHAVRSIARAAQPAAADHRPI
jgi:hypothetical protein